MRPRSPASRLFFFNDTATTEIYTLSLHDALPISQGGDVSRHDQGRPVGKIHGRPFPAVLDQPPRNAIDRKSTRLNSSHSQISYAVFCLKKKTVPRVSMRVVPFPPDRL